MVNIELTKSWYNRDEVRNLINEAIQQTKEVVLNENIIRLDKCDVTLKELDMLMEGFIISHKGE